MNKLILRLTFIILSALCLVAYIIPWANYGVEMPFITKDYKLWLDLQGWVELDYKVDLEEARLDEDFTSENEKEVLESLKRIIDKRIQTLQINDSVITTASYWWEKHIIVQIPLKWKNPEEDKLNIARAKEAIWKVTKILFKERRISVEESDIAERKEIVVKALSELKSSEYNFSVTAAKTKDNYWEVEIWTITLDDESLARFFEIWEWEKKLWLVENSITGNWIGLLTWQDWEWIINIKSIEEGTTSFDYIFVSSKPSDWVGASDTQWRILNDKYFLKASVQYNELFQPIIELTFNDEWAQIFWELSTRLVGQQMAIFVWWELLTDPVINEPILSWKAQISWSYTPDEANILANDINTWVVPAPIYLTSEKAIDSKLWSDSLSKLLVAWSAWFLMIFIFLIFIYRLSWLLASIALLIYVAIILFIVKILWITLTLASIAGLILSIGMAIDANILIFERIRDEIKKGETIAKAAKIWFKKSWSAIWDSNVTGLIVAIILFVFWINLIKGFGLMLAIWIVVSLFSVMWVSRILIFVAAENAKKEAIFIGK